MGHIVLHGDYFVAIFQTECSCFTNVIRPRASIHHIFISERIKTTPTIKCFVGEIERQWANVTGDIC